MSDSYYIHLKPDVEHNERRTFFRSYNQDQASSLLSGQQNVIRITAEPVILDITDDLLLSNLQGPYDRYAELYKAAEEARKNRKEEAPVFTPVSVADPDDDVRDFENFPPSYYATQKIPPLQSFEEFSADIATVIAKGRDPKTTEEYEQRYGDYQGANPVPPSPLSNLNKLIKRIVFGNAESFLSLMPEAVGFRFTAEDRKTVYIARSFMEENSEPAYIPTFRERQAAQSMGAKPEPAQA